MSPDGFMEFRDPLTPASGFQSTQFRAIEAESPRLYDAFVAAAGLPDDHDDRVSALADLYRDHLDDPRRALLHLVAELLLDHDELVALWRHHHTLMAAREIGSRHGTGGSRGVEYLQGTQGKRFYPELWEVRASLTRGFRPLGETRNGTWPARAAFLTSAGAADHADDLVVRRALDHVADRAGARHLVLRDLAVVGADRDQLDARAALADLRRRAHAAATRHVEVEQDDVRAPAGGQLDRLVGVLGLADELEARAPCRSARRA